MHAFHGYTTKFPLICIHQYIKHTNRYCTKHKIHFRLDTVIIVRYRVCHFELYLNDVANQKKNGHTCDHVDMVLNYDYIQGMYCSSNTLHVLEIGYAPVRLCMYCSSNTLHILGKNQVDGNSQAIKIYSCVLQQVWNLSMYTTIFMDSFSNG